MGKNNPAKKIPDASIEITAQELTLAQNLQQHLQHLHELPADSDNLIRAELMLDIAELHLGLDQFQQAYTLAQQSFPNLIQAKQWELAVDACSIMYNADHEDSLAALANGIWLAITFPVDAQLSLQMLHYIVDETPDNSDGAAVAVMLADYLVETRALERDYPNLKFVSTQIIAQVARRHRGIDNQQSIEMWVKMYQLDDLNVLLSRMATMLDAIAAGNWWYDRDEIRASLPLH